MDDEDRYTRITLRIPKDLHRQLSDAADNTSKSLNAEIVGRLVSTFPSESAVEGNGGASVFDRLAAMERLMQVRAQEENGLRLQHMLQSMQIQEMMLQQRNEHERERIQQLEDALDAVSERGDEAASRNLRSKLRDERKWLKELEGNLAALREEKLAVEHRLEVHRLSLRAADSTSLQR